MCTYEYPLAFSCNTDATEGFLDVEPGRSILKVKAEVMNGSACNVPKKKMPMTLLQR